MTTMRMPPTAAPTMRPMLLVLGLGQGIFVSQGRESVTLGSHVPPFLASDIIFCPQNWYPLPQVTLQSDQEYFVSRIQFTYVKGES